MSSLCETVLREALETRGKRSLNGAGKGNATKLGGGERKTKGKANHHLIKGGVGFGPVETEAIRGESRGRKRPKREGTDQVPS